MAKSQGGMAFMCRTMVLVPVLAAIGFASIADPAKAFPFARKKAAPAPATTAAATRAPPQATTSARTALRVGLSPEIQSPGIAPQAGATPGGNPARDTGASQAPTVPEAIATPTERMAARSLDLVAQSRFWLDELRKRPADTEAAYEASIALRAIGSADRAVQAAAMGIQTNANEPRLWSALALGLVADNQNEAAVQALQKAIGLSPRDARLHNGLGVIYDRLEAPALAVSAYQAALVIAPGDSAILSNYGISVAMAGDLPRAEVLLRQATQNPIAPPQARQNLALVVGLQGRFAESEQLAARDLPPAVATENIAYLRRMLNGGDSRWSQAATASN